MPIGLFIITHDEIQGPVLSAGYFRRKIEISKDLITKLYLSHAGYANNACIEIVLPQYKIISYYTGDQARKSGKEGILAIIMEISETFPYLELFIRQNLEQCIGHNSEDFLKSVLEIKLAKYLHLVSLFERIYLESVDFLAVIQWCAESHLLLAKFGSESVPNEIFKQTITQDRNDLPKGYYLVHITTISDSAYYLLVRSKNGPPKEIHALTNQTAVLLKNNLNYSWEILAMSLFPQKITFALDESQELLHLFNSRKSLQDNLSKSTDYRKQFRHFLTAVLNVQIYPVCL